MNLSRRCIVMGAIAGAGLAGCSRVSGQTLAMTPDDNTTNRIANYGRPLVIAHRGYSGKYPEHTLQAYRAALAVGADVIEPDLVFTQDGHLICRHERYLSGTTNVADVPAFAARQTEKVGHQGPDWFAEDFTLVEIKTLRARQAFPGRDTSFDDQFEIPTFAEVMALKDEVDRPLRLYPEAKDPGFAKAAGFDFLASLQPFIDAAAAGALGPSFLQCFDPEFTQGLPPLDNIARIQLLYRPEDVTPASLQRIAEFADGIGVYKALLNADIVAAAHAAGLLVHAWTYRTDNLPDGVQSASDEYAAAYGLGIDGVFSDFPNDALAAR